jgi:hypothetical protein
MVIQIEWERPIQLDDATSGFYSLDLDRLSNTPAVYVFARRFGHQFEALYVGQAVRVRGRVKGQLNNLRLMHHLKKARLGKRLLLIGAIRTQPGQKVAKCLTLAERALIRHFLSEGNDLVNKQGVRLRRHEVHSSGQQPKRFIPRLTSVERSKGE